MSKLEEMMKKDGWVLGRTENWGVEYWAFRRDGFEIAERAINRVETSDDIDGKHFKKWRENNE